MDRPLTVAALLTLHPSPVLSVAGDSALSVRAVANPRNAGPGSLVFVEGADPRAEALAAETSATVVVLAIDAPPPDGRCYIRAADPRSWFIAAMDLLFAPPPDGGVDPSAHISSFAILGRNCRIGAFAVIEEGVVIGDDARIGNHVVIRRDTIVGARTTIQHHVTIAGDGVAFHRDKNGEWHFFPHHGRVLIGEDVAIGSQSVVVRGMLQDTIIGSGSKLGNFVNVGHNCEIGDNCWLSSNVVLCGAARLEADVRLAASVSVSDHVTIGRGARIGLGSVVTKDVPAGAALFGNPAQSLRTLRPF